MIASSRWAPMMERAATRDPLFAKAKGFVGPARAGILGEHAEPHMIGVRLSEHGVDEGAQESLAVPAARTGHHDALQERDLFRRAPVPHDGEADRLGVVARHEEE